MDLLQRRISGRIQVSNILNNLSNLKLRVNIKYTPHRKFAENLNEFVKQMFCINYKNRDIISFL